MAPGTEILARDPVATAPRLGVSRSGAPQSHSPTAFGTLPRDPQDPVPCVHYGCLLTSRAREAAVLPAPASARLLTGSDS